MHIDYDLTYLHTVHVICSDFQQPLAHRNIVQRYVLSTPNVFTATCPGSEEGLEKIHTIDSYKEYPE